MPFKELIQYIAQGLVDNHHSVSVSTTEGAQTTVFELKVAKNAFLGLFVARRMV